MRSGSVAVMVLTLSCGLSVVPALAAPRPPHTQATRHNQLLDRAQALLARHHWQAAHDLIVPWLKSQPKATDRDRGLYLLARVYYQSGDRFRAFYHLDELMDKFPDSRLFFPALQLQYDIADSYLNGFKNRDPFFGFAVIPAYEEAVEMLYRIQERSPGSPLAEKALKRTADYYF